MLPHASGKGRLTSADQDRTAWCTWTSPAFQSIRRISSKTWSQVTHRSLHAMLTHSLQYVQYMQYMLATWFTSLIFALPLCKYTYVLWIIVSNNDSLWSEDLSRLFPSPTISRVVVDDALRSDIWSPNGFNKMSLIEEELSRTCIHNINYQHKIAKKKMKVNIIESRKDNNIPIAPISTTESQS